MGIWAAKRVRAIEGAIKMLETVFYSLNTFVVGLSSIFNMLIPNEPWVPYLRDFLLAVYLFSLYFSGWLDEPLLKLHRTLYLLIAGPFALSLVLMTDSGTAMVLWIGIAALSSSEFFNFQILRKVGKIYDDEVSLYHTKIALKTRDAGEYFVNASGYLAPLIIAVATSRNVFTNPLSVYLFLMYFTVIAIPIYLATSRFVKRMGIMAEPAVPAVTAVILGTAMVGFFNQPIELKPQAIFIFATVASIVACDTIRLGYSALRYGYRETTGSVGGAGIFDGVLAGGIHGVVFWHLWHTEWMPWIFLGFAYYVFCVYLIELVVLTIAGIVIWILWRAVTGG